MQLLHLESESRKRNHQLNDALCLIEEAIINSNIEFDVFDELIKNAKSLIEMQVEMPDFLFIKINYISQLLNQFNHPILENRIKEIVYYVQKEQDGYKQRNIIQNTEKYEISKDQIFDKGRELKYVALSPNENYLLVGLLKEVYLYDLTTKLNKIICIDYTDGGLFSYNSRQIIVTMNSRIQIININTNKRQQLITKGRTECFINQNYLYLTQFNYKKDDLGIFKIDLKSNRKIFSYIIQSQMNGFFYFFEDLISIDLNKQFQILNDTTRKSELKIQLLDYGMRINFFLLNKNQIISCNKKSDLINKNRMLSINNINKRSDMIIWNIDYQNNRLIMNKVLPFTADFLFRGNPNFGYIYLQSKNEVRIIDKNYNFIYSHNAFGYFGFLRNSPQFNTNRIFILSQKDGGVYILKRNQKELIY